MMAVETVVAGSLRRWAAGFAVWVLLAHTLVTACVPAPLLLLSQHDHVVIGKISARQWAAHLQWHLHEVNHHFIPTEPDPSVPTRDTGTILSVAGCDMNALQAFYVTVRGTTPQSAAPAIAVTQAQLAPWLEAEGQSALLRVPCPPPRFA